jgi:hypothetical protein
MTIGARASSLALSARREQFFIYFKVELRLRWLHPRGCMQARTLALQSLLEFLFFKFFRAECGY